MTSSKNDAFAKLENFAQQYRISSKKVVLNNVATSDRGPFADKEEGQAFTRACIEEIRHLQYRLFVEQKQSLLIVLQAPDAAGKDGLIRHVLGRINAQGCSVHPFKVPSEEELAHDFLWRIHALTPAAGKIAVFNRSHYEDVLVVRVKQLVPKEVWQRRYEHINHFEQLLVDRGTRILKFYLHISRHEQLLRFKDRLDDPESQWKLNAGDYEDRNLHDAYRKAYEDVFTKCHRETAPWYVIPADRKWFRDAAVASILLDTLRAMDPQLPPLRVDLEQIRALYEKELAETADSHHP